MDSVRENGSRGWGKRLWYSVVTCLVVADILIVFFYPVHAKIVWISSAHFEMDSDFVNFVPYWKVDGREPHHFFLMVEWGVAAFTGLCAGFCYRRPEGRVPDRGFV